MNKSHQIEKTTKLALERYQAARENFTSVFQDIDELATDPYLSSKQKLELLDVAQRQHDYPDAAIKNTKRKIDAIEP